MDWRISTSIYVITYSFSVLLQRLLVKSDKKEVVSRSIFFQLVTGVLLLIWALTYGTFDLRFDISSQWPYLLFMTVAYGLGNLFIFKALQETSAGTFSIYFSTRAVVNLILSVILFSQSFSLLQILGLALVLSGIIIVDYSPELWIISKGEAFSLLAALMIGSTNAVSQIVLREMELFTFLSLSFLLPPIFMAIVKPKEAKNVISFLKLKIFVKYLLMGIIFSAASIFFFKAIQDSDNSSLVTSVGLSSVIVTVLFSYVLLKERENFIRKLIAAIVTFGGLMLLM